MYILYFSNVYIWRWNEGDYFNSGRAVVAVQWVSCWFKYLHPSLLYSVCMNLLCSGLEIFLLYFEVHHTNNVFLFLNLFSTITSSSSSSTLVFFLLPSTSYSSLSTLSLLSLLSPPSLSPSLYPESCGVLSPWWCSAWSAGVLGNHFNSPHRGNSLFAGIHQSH